MHWLDKIIAEQAHAYGMTVEEYERFSLKLSAICEQVTEADEPQAVYHGKLRERLQVWEHLEVSFNLTSRN